MHDNRGCCRGPPFSAGTDRVNRSPPSPGASPTDGLSICFFAYSDYASIHIQDATIDVAAIINRNASFVG
jgi:hypothetical protein